MGPQKRTALFIGFSQEEQKGHRLFSHPLIMEIILSFIEELPSDQKDRKQVLDQIEHYLFEQPNVTCKKLDKCLSEEFYSTLYGLKSLLQKDSLEVVTRSLKENKKRFKAFLYEELGLEDTDNSSPIPMPN